VIVKEEDYNHMKQELIFAEHTLKEIELKLKNMDGDLRRVVDMV
jgi:hypothetical protein